MITNLSSLVSEFFPSSEGRDVMNNYEIISSFYKQDMLCAWVPMPNKSITYLLPNSANLESDFSCPLLLKGTSSHPPVFILRMPG